MRGVAAGVLEWSDMASRGLMGGRLDRPRPVGVAPGAAGSGEAGTDCAGVAGGSSPAAACACSCGSGLSGRAAAAGAAAPSCVAAVVGE